MNKYNPEIHHRKSIRLKGYDYSKNGAYFITICTHNKENLFGKIINGEINLNEYGQILYDSWFDLENHYKNIELDFFVIMPNHFHCILMIIDNDEKQKNELIDNDIVVGTVGTGLKPVLQHNQEAPNNETNTTKKYHVLSEIIRALKTFSAKKINKLRDIKGVPVWQKNYFEHIIRDENALNKIREYIINNPINWEKDKNYMVKNNNVI